MAELRVQETAAGTVLVVRALGAVRVTRDDVDQHLGGARQRRLLAVLLIHAGSVVSVDRLAAVVFAGEPTDAAATTLRSYVARLRRVLGPAVVTRSPGYQLALAGVRFDVAEFEAGVQAGRTALARQDAVTAVHQLRSALALWQGDAYAEFADEAWAYPESQRLSELRLTAEELLVDAELARGNARDVLPTIEALCRAHALREAFRGQLMTAYYRVGRQADALAVLRGFRAELAEELGIDPSPALVELERRILAQDPGLGATCAGEPLRGYRLGERLGSGRDGTVHAARLPGVDRAFVVKTLRPEVADDPGFIRAFEATAHRLTSLRHPAVVPLHDWWREPGAAYVVMPRLPGGTLQDRLQRSRPGRAEVVDLVDRVGGALAAAAATGLAHGRVTVDNVLYDASGEPVLTDFWLGGPDEPSPEDDVRAFADLVTGVLGDGVPPELTGLLRSPAGASVQELTERVLAALGGDQAVAPGRNPYRGLRAFDEADAADYFGRAALVDDVLARLADDGLPGRLVLLVGASGTGKSSAVRAGLLPRLRAGEVPGSDAWFVATMLPGGAPYDELAESLRRVAVGETEDLVARLRARQGIDRTVRRLVPEDGQLLLVIDQLEELFTLSPEAEQRAFLEAVTHALSVPDSRLRVVATLRADYFDRPLGLQPFGSLVQCATVTIPAMLPGEVEAAVVEPARRAGRVVERALAAELVGALAAEPAALPALQFVLYELAEDGAGDLSLAAYRALGGIDGAIARRAEELYRSLDDDDRQHVRDLFERLVVVTAEGDATRRRADRDEVEAAAGVVDRWAAARLLTLDVHPQTRVPTVEVAHEALIREWPRLRQWIEDDRSELVVLGRVREAAATWAELGRDPSALLRGATLEAALDVIGGRAPLTSLEQEFVDASRAARAVERAQQAELIRRQARTNRRLRLQLAGIAVALLVALVGGLVALDQRQQAVSERHVAVARELAAAADGSIQEDPERSILLALAAVDATRRYDEPVLPEALEALHRAVSSARVLRSFPGVGGALDWSADGRLFVTEGPEETGLVDVRDARSGRTRYRFRADGVDINDVALSPDGTRVVTAGDEGAVRVWDLVTGRAVAEVAARDRWTVGTSFGPDGRQVAAAWPESDTVRVFPAAGGSSVVFRVRWPLDTAFSPDGRRLAAVSGWSEVVVFDLASRRRVLRIPTGWGPRELAWSPDGRRIAVATEVDAVIIDVRTGRRQPVGSGHTAPVSSVAWAPDSATLATASDDGTARIHEVGPEGGREVLRLAAQERTGVQAVEFSPDGEQLMTSDFAITAVKVWDVRAEGAPEVANLPGDAGNDRGAVVTPDGRSVWTVAGGGRLARHDLATGAVRQRLPAPPVGRSDHQRLALSADGSLLAAASPDLPFPVWDTRTGEVAFVVGEDQAGDALVALEWSPDGQSGQHLVFVVGDGTDDSAIRVVDGTGAEVGAAFGEPGIVVPSLAVSGDGNTVATTGRGYREEPELRAVRLWDRRTGRLVRRIPGDVHTLAYDPTGELVATGRRLEAVLDVWDAATGSRVATLQGHTGAITDLAFDADGDRVASASTDGSVRIWDPRTGKLELTLRLGTPVGAAGVTFTPDGRRLVTTWLDGVTRVWTLDLDELVAIARTRVTRGLTTAECRQYLHVDTCPGA